MERGGGLGHSVTAQCNASSTHRELYKGIAGVCGVNDCFAHDGHLKMPPSKVAVGKLRRNEGGRGGAKMPHRLHVIQQQLHGDFAEVACFTLSFQR